jgi:hypothetical protein
MSPVDLKKDLKSLYGPAATAVAIVNVPTINFLMVDGSGDPNTSVEYREAVEALYAVSYGAKFKIKRADPSADFSVMPLEGLWWTDDVTAADLWERKDTWHWTAMIAQPDPVTADVVAEVIAEAGKRKALPALSKLRLERFEEGLCVQIMHIGPYAAERPTIEKLHAFADTQGYKLRGKHHEIYLGDPRRSAPEKLRTIIRQPVE